MKRIRVLDLFTRSCIICAGLGLLAAPAQATAPNDSYDPHGIWLRPDGGEQFSFYDCGSQLCAKLVAVAKPEDQKSIGTVILRGASKSGPNEWKGKLYNAADGKTYDGSITVKSANELRLKGCLWGILCSGETWTRVGAVPKPQAALELRAKAAKGANAD